MSVPLPWVCPWNIDKGILIFASCYVKCRDILETCCIFTWEILTVLGILGLSSTSGEWHYHRSLWGARRWGCASCAAIWRACDIDHFFMWRVLLYKTPARFKCLIVLGVWVSDEVPQSNRLSLPGVRRVRLGKFSGEWWRPNQLLSLSDG